MTFQRVGEEELFSVPALGGAPRRFPWTGGALTWSPDGDTVAYTSDGAIFVAPSAGGGEPRKVTDAFQPFLLSWSPDGSQIAFNSGNLSYLGLDYELLNVAPSSIWVVAASGGEPVRVTDGAHLDFGPVWSPDV